MVTETAAIRFSTQVICDSISRRRFRPQFVTNSIETAIKTCAENGRNVKKYRRELELVRTWLLDPNFATNIDIVVFRLCRALPVTKKSKRKLLTRLRRYCPENNKNWRSIPNMDRVSGECSTDVKRHIDVLVSIIESTEPVCGSRF